LGLISDIKGTMADKENAVQPVYDLTGVLCGMTDAYGKLPSHLQRGIYIVGHCKVVKE
jgi:hypothetical protein